MPPLDDAPTAAEYMALAAETQQRLAGLDFDKDEDYKEGMEELARLNLAGALLKAREAEGK